MTLSPITPTAAALTGLICAVCLSPRCALAQAPIAFEAASIHPSDPANHGCQYFWPDAGRFRSINSTLKCLTRAGYGVENYQIRGADGWMDSQGYDIDASAVPPVTDRSLRQAMIQQFLAERFHLQVHREKKQVSGFVLVVAKGGPKLEEVAAEGVGVSVGPRRTNGRGANMETLARVLSTHLEHPVRDGTGLHGYYNFSMTWAPLTGEPSDDPAPDLLAALQEQLGLRLEKERAEVEIITIQHAEKPGEN